MAKVDALSRPLMMFVQNATSVTMLEMRHTS